MAQQKKKTTTTKKKTTGSSRSSSSGKRTAKKNQKRPILSLDLVHHSINSNICFSFLFCNILFPFQLI